MIYIDDIKLDLYDNTVISFAITFMDIRNIGNATAEGEVSFQFDIPATAHNVKLLGHYSPYFPRKNKIAYVFAPEGTFYHNGFIRIIDRSKDKYTCILTVNNSEWIDAIRDLEMTDVEMGLRLFDFDEFQDAIDDQSEVMYPFFKLFESQFGTPVSLNQFKPAPNIGNGLRKMFKLIGYETDFVGKLSLIDKLHAYRGKPTDAEIRFENASTALDALQGIGTTYQVYWIAPGGPNVKALLPLTRSVVTSDPGDNLTTGTYTAPTEPPPDTDPADNFYPTYTSEKGGNIRVELDLRIRISSTPAAEYSLLPIPITVMAIKTPFTDDFYNIITDFPDYDILTQQNIQYTGHIQQLNPVPTDIETTLPTFTLQQGEGFFIAYYFGAGYTSDVKFFAYKQNMDITVMPTLVSEGLEYNVQDSFPTVTGGALLKSMIQNLNILTYTEKQTVKFINRDDWYLDTEDNWSDKVDTSFPITHRPIADISREQQYRYKEDNDDTLLEVYESDNELEYGSKDFRFNDDLLTGTNVATDALLFAASIEKTTSDGFIFLNGWKQGESADDFWNNYNMTDRIFYNRGKVGKQNGFTIGHDDTTTDLFFFAQAEFERLTFDNLFPNFFQKTMDFIRDGEFVECVVRLSRADKSQLNYRTAKRIRLSDGNEVKAWINKIEDFRPGTSDPVKIEFITYKNPG